MAIKLVDDVGAPCAVAGADILTDVYQPSWNKPLGIGLAVVGMVCAGMNVGGQFVKNLGIASTPWAIESIYLLVKESQGAGARGGDVTRMRLQPAGRVGSYPAQPKNMQPWPTAV